ncbi:YbaB/EbfC family nucleoid-associated protein [Actinopolymorpha sp. B17G11]|uniref:YbaB/EbfC family nucleoid-associated protein n=1 Tax=unclassified Actinopolymorpha TaxID=2627063 RepID=UPI0032D92C3B
MTSESFDLRDLLRSPEEIMATQREQLAKAEELQRRIGEVTGSATSEDERISVSFNEATGVEELKLDPRVMRMPSEDLAAEILRLVNAARADAQGQIQVVLDETFGGDGRPDPEEIGEQVAELQQSLDEMMGDTMRMDGELTSVLEQMRKLAGE